MRALKQSQFSYQVRVFCLYCMANQLAQILWRCWELV